jgi:hypothetical protein
LEARRREVVRAKRRLEVEELNILRVLDERGRVSPTVDEQGESPRVVRDKVETARRWSRCRRSRRSRSKGT